MCPAWAPAKGSPPLLNERQRETLCDVLTARGRRFTFGKDDGGYVLMQLKDATS